MGNKNQFHRIVPISKLDNGFKLFHVFFRRLKFIIFYEILKNHELIV